MNGHKPAAGEAGFREFLASRLGKSKWLIGAAAVVAAAVAYAVAQAGTVQIWSGRTILSIGVAPSQAYLLFEDAPALEVIEPQRAVILRVSSPAFKNSMLNKAAFEPATAARSRSLVDSSLRAIALDGDRDISIELSAASAADVEAALRALEVEIGKTHGDLLHQRMQILQSRIDQDRQRMANIEKTSDQLLDGIFNGSDDKDKSRPAAFEFAPAWNDLKNRIQRDTNLKQLVVPTVLHLEPGSFLQGPRSVAVLRTSLLAGLVMLIVIVVLTLLVNARTHSS